MTNPVVVDLSHHNPTPNWTQLKAAGTVGVIHKATEGTSYVDDTLFSRARAAMDAGLCWSTYHFLRPGDMVAQMQHYLDTVDPREGERMCLDHEDAGVSLSDLKQAVQILLDDPRKLQVTIYSGHVIEEQLGDACDQFLAENTSLWTCQYTSASAPSWCVATWPTWSLWQYTDRASVQGVSQPVDGNKWNGDEAGLIAWFGPAEAVAPEPEPEEPEEYYPIPITITMPPEQKLVVNGQEVEHA
jgi:GH25 family lysozyme M1 (1,4-beta-N-acetylmuramidase)